ncbi:uncharacterized protein UMAG_03424 [Mycosarcoma maydis]|uniref:Uncharacterized protein n=1 Tax=Mycosarcoma maydis TaxID=5270 RepID=A0A0D1DXI3_MYCMD|nr:uncharacterized protein UMAG_03424 [Ustilago maydis 521]KIS68326.1 hypothetical protein UMAG_03424 [Ustilago maydis 521]|eukprot:XP_011389894.1 hypothetical protein UMAG_03424 [Ustilago maydis 521]
MSEPRIPWSPALSSTSSTASTTATIIDSSPNPKSVSNLFKQLKYLVIGLTLSLYLQVPQHLSDAVSLGVSSVSAKLALLSLALLVVTLAIFTHIVLLPARGFAVNYVDWKSDVRLATSIPALTVCILLGWSSLLITLSPLGAPLPPSSGIHERLAQAAQLVNSRSLLAQINTLPTTYFSSSTREISWDKLSSLLSLSSSSSSTLHTYFDQLSARADQWSHANLRAIGWTGALIASISTYLAAFGTIGIIGFLAPDNRPSKHKSF